METNTQIATLEGIKIIDSDTHYSEPHDLWTSRAPAKFRDRVPQVKVLNGKRAWVIDGDHPIGFNGKANPASTMGKDGTMCPGLDFMDWEIEDVHPASYDVKARVQMMDENGIWAQILYGNLLGFGGQVAARLDAELRLASVQIYNDAMAELQEKSGNRIFPMALLPWWGVKQSVIEAKRCRAMGLRGVNINTDPHDHGLPDLGNTHWDPLWETCVDLKLPVNFHIGASDQSMDWYGKQPWPGQEQEAKLLIGGILLFFGNARVMTNLLMCGVLDRHPDLKFVSVESGVGWIPFLLEAVNYHLADNAPFAKRKLKLTPQEYFRRNMAACFWFEQEDFAHTLRRVGVDNVMFETDFPHPTCLYPPSKSIAASLKDLTFEEQRKVLSGNAANLYSIPLP